MFTVLTEYLYATDQKMNFILNLRRLRRFGQLFDLLGQANSLAWPRVTSRISINSKDIRLHKLRNMISEKSSLLFQSVGRSN